MREQSTVNNFLHREFHTHCNSSIIFKSMQLELTDEGRMFLISEYCLKILNVLNVRSGTYE